MNQQTDLLKALRRRRNTGISQYEAMVLLGIGRLSERIRELEAKGYAIKRKTETKYGKYRLVRYTRYWLIVS